MTTNKNQPNEPPTKLASLNFEGIIYGIPRLMPIAEIFFALPDLESKQNFHKAHKLVIEKLTEILNNPLETQQACIWYQIAKRAGFNFLEYYLNVFTLRYCELMLGNLVGENKLYKEAVAIKKAIKHGGSFFEENIELKERCRELMPASYWKCFEAVCDAADKVYELEERDEIIQKSLKDSTKNAAKLGQELKTKTRREADSESPFLCPFCRRYLFFKRKAKDIPSHCGNDDCYRAYRKTIEGNRDRPDRRKDRGNWVAVDDTERRCRGCHKEYALVDTEGFCLDCVIEIEADNKEFDKKK